MKLSFNPNLVEDYRRFLQVKGLPRFRIVGRTAEVPDEYAHLIGVEPEAAATLKAYKPLAGMFDYQGATAREAIRKRKYAAFMGCGMGKTLVMLEFARYVKSVVPKDRCILITSPLMVIRQTIAEAERFYGNKLKIQQIRSAGLAEWLTTGSGIGITNYEAIVDGLPSDRLAALILDECFPKGTPVDVVENGASTTKVIENVLPSDKIINAAGVDTVKRVKKTKVQYAVAFTAGKRIVSSPNHPVFTQRGWVAAQDLEPGDAILLAREAVRMVRNGVHTNQGAGPEQVLREVLLSEMADDYTDTFCQGAYSGNAREDRQGEGGMVGIGRSESGRTEEAASGTECHVGPGSAGEGVGRSEEDGPQTFRAWGQWQGDDLASEDFAGCVGRRLDSGICVVAGPTDSRLSNVLQARLGERRAKSLYRSGWKLSLQPQGRGRKERREAGFARVESLEVLEQGHPELERLRDADGELYFYDLEAELHPSFSVEGLLVHNSAMLKSAYGKWGTRLIEMGRGLEWKLCLTGLPAPNDRIEYANHAVFLDQFPTVNSFLARFFVNRGQTDNRWELKPHALRPFYRALSHWCIFLNDPSVYGWKDNCGTTPPIQVHIDEVQLSGQQWEAATAESQSLFPVAGGITSRAKMAQIAKGHYNGETIESAKPAFIKAIVDREPNRPTIIWCKYNREQEEMAKLFPGCANISGDTPDERRQEYIEDFQASRRKIMISKGKCLGYGLNLQVCTRMIFSTLIDSYEEYWQCVKRANRYGSTEPLQVYLPLSEIERPMVENVLRKAKQVDQDIAEQELIFREVAGNIFR